MTRTPAPALTAVLDELDELRAKATPGEWFLSGLSAYADIPGHPHSATANGPHNAALIVAAVNRLPELTAALRAVADLVRAADENAVLIRRSDLRHILNRLTTAPEAS